MNLSSSLKLGSLLVALGCACAAASSCADQEDDGAVVVVPSNTTPMQPEQVSVDTGAALTVTPGQGVGVFVEYTSGGQWTITTSCDTLESQYACGFDLFVSGVSSSTALTNVQGTNLSDTDQLDLGRDGTVHLLSLIHI